MFDSGSILSQENLGKLHSTFNQFIKPNLEKFTIRHSGQELEILCWNVHGISKFFQKGEQTDKRGSLNHFLEKMSPSVVCIQETLLQEQNVDDAKGQLLVPSEYQHYQYYNCSTKHKGQAGVLTITKQKPEKVDYKTGRPTLDGLGRIITLHFHKYIIVNTYMPYVDDAEDLEFRTKKWDKSFGGYIEKLQEEGKQVIIAGDFNCEVLQHLKQQSRSVDTKGEHKEKERKVNAQMKEKIKQSFESSYLKHDLMDTFGYLYSEKRAYVYKDDYKDRSPLKDQNQNSIKRIDFILTPNEMQSKLHSAYIIQIENNISDHDPIGVKIFQ